MIHFKQTNKKKTPESIPAAFASDLAKGKEHKHEELLTIKWSPRSIGGDVCDVQSPKAAS